MVEFMLIYFNFLLYGPFEWLEHWFFSVALNRNKIPLLHGLTLNCPIQTQNIVFLLHLIESLNIFKAIFGNRWAQLVPFLGSCIRQSIQEYSISHPLNLKLPLLDLNWKVSAIVVLSKKWYKTVIIVLLSDSTGHHLKETWETTSEILCRQCLALSHLIMLVHESDQ